MTIKTRSLGFFLIGALLIGCGQPTQPPTPTATAENDNATATPAKTQPPEEAYVRIKNKDQGVYLYEAENQVRYGNPDLTDQTAHWLLEDYQGSKRIKNRVTGDYMSIEHLLGYVECIPAQDVWMSVRWTFETNPTTGDIALRNVWHNWEVLHIDGLTGYAEHGRSTAGKGTALWTLETLTGAPLPTPTTAAAFQMPTPSRPIGSRGAATPWIEYEAEEGSTNGTHLGPSRTFGEIAAESSGRESIQLNAVGDYVEFTTSQAANSIVVRYVIPDAPDGTGLSATLSLYVNGAFRQKLNLTSKYAWSYGGEANAANEPRFGGAHHFFDEARALVDAIPTGATVKLQKEKDDTAAYYVIDLIDLEQVAPPLTMPAGFISIAECGATPDDGTDDGPAIQQCINTSKTQGKGIWIPVGTFESTSIPLTVSEATVRGAGMWYSTLHGFYARFECLDNNCRYYDFAILGETVTRNDGSPENGFNGGAGRGSRLENIWVEHTKVGYWVGPGLTEGLIILHSRFRNLFADGVNFSNGTSHSLIEDSHFRNTGDDALASWSPVDTGATNTNNIFRFNTVQVPWRANCFAIYGGKDNAIEDNVCSDVVTYPGILVAQDFNSHLFAGTTRIERNSLIRAGGPMFRQEHGALKLQAAQETISQVVVKDILIDRPTFSGLELEGGFALRGITFENIQIINPGTWGIQILSNVTGDATFTNVTVSNPGKDGLLNDAPTHHFTLTQGEGNSGW